jgi:hypothetical protein
MKAIKTIVATAVVVFTLTTVAMAGVRHFGGEAGASGSNPVATAQAMQQGDSVTLSAQQFAALLHAVSRGGAQHLPANKTGGGAHARAHAHSQARTHVHAQNHAAAHTQQAAQTTHHAETHHTKTRARTHDIAAHDGGSHAGAHDGGGHGGCD